MLKIKKNSFAFRTEWLTRVFKVKSKVISTCIKISFLRISFSFFIHMKYPNLQSEYGRSFCTFSER